MPNKKKTSQAERVVSGKKSKNVKPNNAASKGKGSTDAKKVSAGGSSSIPARVISSMVFLGLFVLFLVIAFLPEGALTRAGDF